MPHGSLESIAQAIARRQRPDSPPKEISPGALYYETNHSRPAGSSSARPDLSEAAMRMINLTFVGMLGSLLLMAGLAVGYFRAEPPGRRAQLDELLKQGNYKEAYEGF